MRAIFFFETVQNWFQFSKMQKKKKKCEKFFVSEIIASEDVGINSLCQEENTCHWQAVC